MFFLFFAGPSLFADEIVGEWTATSMFASSYEIDYEYFWNQDFWFVFKSNGKGKYGIRKEGTKSYAFKWNSLFSPEGTLSVYELQITSTKGYSFDNNYLHINKLPTGEYSFIYYLNQDEEINMQFYGVMRRIE